MATKRIIPLNQIEGVAVGGTAKITLPTNVRYHGICLEYNTDTGGGATEANMKLEIGDVNIRLDEVTQRRFNPKQLFDINRTKKRDPIVGSGTPPGFLPIYFSEPQRLNTLAREATAWGMKGVKDFDIEVNILNNAGQVPSLRGFAVVDDVQEAPAGIVKWKRSTIQVAGTGELPYSLNLVNGDSHQGLFFFETADGDIDDILLEWDGVKVSQLNEYQQAAFIAGYTDFAQVSGLVHVPLDMNNPPDALRSVKEINGQRQLVQEVIATLNMGAANNVTLMRELVGTPD